jgi:hypothetical protein
MYEGILPYTPCTQAKEEKNGKLCAAQSELNILYSNPSPFFMRYAPWFHTKQLCDDQAGRVTALGHARQRSKYVRRP